MIMEIPHLIRCGISMKWEGSATWPAHIARRAKFRAGGRVGRWRVAGGPWVGGGAGGGWGGGGVPGGGGAGGRGGGGRVAGWPVGRWPVGGGWCGTGTTT